MEDLVAHVNERCKTGLPGLFGIHFSVARKGFITAHMQIRPEMLAPNGYLHAASVVALADTACGNGCMISLPEGAHLFTTIELKSNHMGTATQGTLDCDAQMLHGGRSTQVWDATVKTQSGERTLAAFRCTQMILYPK